MASSPSSSSSAKPYQNPSGPSPTQPISLSLSKPVYSLLRDRKRRRYWGREKGSEHEVLEEEDDDDDPVFVLTDEWREFFAKSEAKRKLEKKQAKKKGKK
ncbi:hypothetical protein FH972_026851 [Carpinus fangiana]|uniref:Uncharacterized protein n=1 Tax=Carpinus fangiana TaxID=176857 RepID=A0A5N6L5K8_9ROSI|nr:hypothetical protein FH972_026851 [Carpinus fangiana]